MTILQGTVPPPEKKGFRSIIPNVKFGRRTNAFTE